MKIRILGVVIISVASIALGLLAPAGTTPPDPQYAHRVDYNGKTFWTDDEGATYTGAVPVDADKGFVPNPHGPSLGPDIITDPVCAQPPAQSARDHATFSSAELAMYGLPERLNGQSMAEWEQIVRSAKVRTCTLNDSYFDGRPTRNGQAVAHSMTPSKPGIHNTLGSWTEVNKPKPYAHSGWVAHENTYPETEAVAYWHFPTVVTEPTLYSETMSVWTALGDDSPYTGCSGLPGMLQDGTGSQNIRGVANYYMWVQNLGSTPDCGEEQLGGLVEFHNGDLIYSADVAGLNSSTVFLQDQTIGDYYSGPVPLSGNNNGPYTGSSACIVEQNHLSDILPNFGTVDFQWCRAYVTVNGTSTLYSITHLPGNLALFRHQDTDGAAVPVYPTDFCDFAEVPNNPDNPTYPDSSFNVDYIQGCA